MPLKTPPNRMHISAYSDLCMHDGGWADVTSGKCVRSQYPQIRGLECICLGMRNVIQIYFRLKICVCVHACMRSSSVRRLAHVHFCDERTYLPARRSLDCVSPSSANVSVNLLRTHQGSNNKLHFVRVSGILRITYVQFVHINIVVVSLCVCLIAHDNNSTHTHTLTKTLTNTL